jgi:hypothetical protein
MLDSGAAQAEGAACLGARLSSAFQLTNPTTETLCVAIL